MKVVEAEAAGHSAAPRPDGQDSARELENLRATCRRQAAMIETLGDAVSTFERGAKALKAENAEFRAEIDRLRRGGPVASSHEGRDTREQAELAITLNAQAPGVGRRMVERYLTGHVTSAVLDSALLLVSELVTNGVRHSGAPDGGELTVRVHVWRDGCRLEVEDPGGDGVIAPKPRHAGEGMGLRLVELLSDHWGVVRAAGGPTRVWAQLPRGSSAAA